MFNKISKLGGELLIPTLEEYIKGEIKSIQQNNSKSSYVGMLSKKDGHIDWKKTAIEIERFIRAMNPWPGAFGTITNYELKITNKLIKIIEVDNTILKINKYKLGELFLYNNKLAVQCVKDALIIKKSN